MKEQTIKGFDNYTITSTGVVRNKKTGNRLFGNINHDGYLRVKLTNNGKSRSIFVHRLVAEHFLPNDDDTLEVNHIDENKLNNNIENLEWVDHTQNMRHSCDKKVICLNDNKTYPSARDAAKAYNLHPMSVREVARGKKNSLYGMRFEYVA